MGSYRIGLYGNGLFNEASPSPPYAAQIAQLTGGGYTFVLLWSIHVHANGDLYYNDTLIVSGGVVTLPDQMASNVKALVAGGIKEILLSIGAWGTASDFTNLQTSWNSGGRANLQALLRALPITAVDFDYEGDYGTQDQATLVDLTQKIAALGVGITYCPYAMTEFWIDTLRAVYQQCGRQPVLWMNLQCYAGGAGNDPTDWVEAVAAAKVGVENAAAFIVPGYWVANGGQGDTCPEALQAIFTGFQGSGISGGFLWNSGDLFANESTSSALCDGQSTMPADYANAIKNGLGGTTTPSQRARA
jgi:hypothetical protein